MDDPEIAPRQHNASCNGIERRLEGTDLDSPEVEHPADLHGSLQMRNKQCRQRNVVFGHRTSRNMAPHAYRSQRRCIAHQTNCEKVDKSLWQAPLP